MTEGPLDAQKDEVGGYMGARRVDALSEMKGNEEASAGRVKLKKSRKATKSEARGCAAKAEGCSIERILGRG